MTCKTLALTIALMAACGSSKDDKEQARDDRPSRGDAVDAKAVAEPAGLPVATKLDCAALVPNDLVHEHFPGATVTQYDNEASRKRLNLPPNPGDARCDIDDDMGPITVIDFRCSTYIDDEMVAKTYASVTQDKVIPNLGRGAGELPMQISVADDDTACFIVMSFFPDDRDALVALAREIVPLVTPALIGAR